MDIKKQIIHENNIMIARFMNGEIKSDGIVSKNPDEAPMDVVGYNSYGFLLYDDSWEWLMPVIEKLETTIPNSSLVLYNNIAQWDVDEFIGETKLDAAYKAVSFVITSLNSELN